jgi:nicotinic acid mononucleotide adenylyltransferase
MLIGEMTTAHHNKPSEKPAVIVDRAQKAAEYLGIPVFVTQEALLEEKIKNIECFRNGIGYFHFVMGYDVYDKVVNTPSTKEFLMRNYNMVKLIVFPRNNLSITEAQVKNQPFLSHLCLSHDVQNVKIDISSTQIRNEST